MYTHHVPTGMSGAGYRSNTVDVIIGMIRSVPRLRLSGQKTPIATAPSVATCLSHCIRCIQLGLYRRMVVTYVATIRVLD